jgi:N-acetylmuramoyl-L-alanine amidase
MKTIKLILNTDNGHGIDTPGKRSPLWPNGKQLFEWSWTRDIVARILLKSQDKPWKTFNVVPEDKDVSLSARKRRINRNNKATKYSNHLTISVHGNAYKKNIGKGIEVFTSPGQTDSDIAAEFFYEEMLQVNKTMRTDTSDGDHDKEARFSILLCNGPCYLTESGFYTHFKECMWMLSEEGREEIADAHIRAVQRYYDYLLNKS